MSDRTGVPDFWIWGTGHVTGRDYLSGLPRHDASGALFWAKSGFRSRRVASWSALSARGVGFKPQADGWSLTPSTRTYNRADGTGRILVQGDLLEGYSNGAAGN